MVVWPTLVIAATLIAAVSWWMIRQNGNHSAPRDADWGDWPSDQMGR